MPKQGWQQGTPARRAEFIERLRRMGEGEFCVYWPWSDSRSGYTRVHIDGKKVSAHRWVFEQINGHLEDHDGPGARGEVIMHTCDNPPCVRPSHLRLDDQGGNIRDAVQKNRMKGGTGGDFRRKLSDESVADIRRLAMQPRIRQVDLARAYSVSEATISLIVHNKARVGR